MIPAIVADLSSSGVRLVGDGFPVPGTWISLALAVPRREVEATGRVVWADHGGHAIGVELDRKSARHQEELAMAKLAVASDREPARPAAALLVDDVALAVRLCEPLRDHGFVPLALRTQLEAAAAFNGERPRVQLAVVGVRALGMAATDVNAFLAKEFARIPRIALADLADRFDELPMASPARRLLNRIERDVGSSR